jgi:hypothetical protein
VLGDIFIQLKLLGIILLALFLLSLMVSNVAKAYTAHVNISILIGEPNEK